MENLNGKPKNIEAIFDVVEANEPKPKESFTPDKQSSDEQKRLFLDGQILNPSHSYEELVYQDFEYRKSIFENALNEVEGHNLDIANQLAYSGVIKRYIKTNEFMRLCSEYLQTQDETTREKISAGIIELNVELYGEPDKDTYQALISEELSSSRDIETPTANLIREELSELVSTPSGENRVFTPSDETIQLANRAVLAMYGGLISHIPADKDEFNPKETRQLFEEIIQSEFGESAKDWQVILTDSTAINVIAGEKLVKIPVDRRLISQQKMQGLVVHEIGVHVLRSIMGGSSNVSPLKLGLSDYMDNEEGLAKVMEQSVNQKYTVAGKASYIAAGLAYFEGKDFRGVFETLWRLSALKKLEGGQPAEEENLTIQKAKDFAYRQTFRIFRGTDNLPWFKELAYFNGTEKVWRYLEDFGADFTTFSMLLMGKADPSNEEHRRILFATKSKRA